MTYEKEIPAYALQVARAPKIVPCQAVYHTEKMTSPGGRQTVRYQFEEDILVPDTKEDMAEILLMEADCDLLPTERKLSPKTDGLLNLTGTITIQTLYRPEKADCLPVSITSKVPYQYQWHLHCNDPAEGLFSCRVKALEYMIINERKFRVKVTLEFTCMLLLEQELSLFQGLEQEELEMKTEEISLRCLAAMKKESLEIDAWVDGTDTKDVPIELLQQRYTLAENYRQVTSEKIVLNGFLFTELLYRARSEDGEEKLCSQKGRIEFTQFLPLEKQYRGRKWSLVKSDFRNQGLRATLEKKEDGMLAFHVGGHLETCISLYEDREQEMVTDAYHQVKSFTCNFERQRRRDIICAAVNEFPFRELIHLPEGAQGEEAVCVRCHPNSWDCKAEKERIRMEIELEAVSLWKGEGEYRATKSTHKLQQSVEVEDMEPGAEVSLEIVPKECRLNLISERQIELSGSLLIYCDGSREREMLHLEAPAFIEGDFDKGPAMVITAVERGEDLWALAKRHRTTEKKIRKVNHLETDPVPGQKLLIMK